MRKVLVVDDEFLVRVGIKSFLNWEENGYTIIGEAADGKQALEIMERELPDVVLTDLKMDERRDAAEQFPALSAGICGVLSDRYALAGFRPSCL